MKKKPLLFALLALAIVTSLTAGTLAVYTKSVALDTKVTVKRFAFNTTGIDKFADSIVLAPTESETKSFMVSNYTEKNQPAEVPLSYTITVNISNAKDMVGLTAKLKEKGSKSYLYEGKANETFTYSETKVLAESKAEDREYEVILEWVDDGTGKEAQADYAKTPQTYAKGLEITVQATQKI